MVDVSAVTPRTSGLADVAAAERRRRMGNYWFVQPVLTGAYPKVLPSEREHDLLNWRDGDERRMRADLDYVGINYYSRSTAGDDPGNASGVPGLNSTYEFATGSDAKTGLRLGHLSPGLLRCPARHAPADRRPADRDHRERRGLQHPPLGRWPRARPGAHRLPAGPPAGPAASDRRRRACARLPLLEPDGQLRVGRRLQRTLRPHLRRLRWRRCAHGEGTRASGTPASPPPTGCSEPQGWPHLVTLRQAASQAISASLSRCLSSVMG